MKPDIEEVTRTGWYFCIPSKCYEYIEVLSDDTPVVKISVSNGYLRKHGVHYLNWVLLQRLGPQEGWKHELRGPLKTIGKEYRPTKNILLFVKPK